MVTEFEQQLQNLSHSKMPAATSLLWNNLTKCFSEDVLLSKISHDFLELSLRFILRFSLWLKDIVKSTEWKTIDSLISIFMEIQQLTTKIENQFTSTVIEKMNGNLSDTIKGIEYTPSSYHSQR
jgi:hypothetical protein